MTLREQIADLLSKHSPVAAKEWNRLYLSSNEMPGGYMGIEVARINEFWRWQLANLPEDTIEVRSWLDDTIPHDMYIREFEINILPTIIRHQLPKQLNY